MVCQRRQIIMCTSCLVSCETKCPISDYIIAQMLQKKKRKADTRSSSESMEMQRNPAYPGPVKPGQE